MKIWNVINKLSRKLMTYLVSSPPGLSNKFSNLGDDEFRLETLGIDHRFNGSTGTYRKAC